MLDLIWINGEILHLSDARISVEDRGYQFADGVYEVIRLYGGKPFTLEPHLDRLIQSARGIEMNVPLEKPALTSEIRKIVAKSGVADGFVYLQLTRGVAPRNHVFPDNAKPTLLFYARPLPPPQLPGVGEGVKLVVVASAPKALGRRRARLRTRWQGRLLRER